MTRPTDGTFFSAKTMTIDITTKTINTIILLSGTKKNYQKNLKLRQERGLRWSRKILSSCQYVPTYYSHNNNEKLNAYIKLLLIK